MSKPIHCIEKDSFRWIYEDELPEEMTDKEYDEWFKKSQVVHGVRMGPDPTWINKRRIKMGYTEDHSMVRVDFFGESGKWYCTEAVKWTGAYYGTTSHGLATSDEIQTPYDAFLTSLKNHLGDRLHSMTAVCLEPYHEFSYPLMVKGSKWQEA